MSWTPTILVTAFGPFPGAPHNPTPAMLRALLRLRRPALSGVRLVGHEFKVSYAAVEADLPRLIAEHRPDAVLMLGLAARTKFVRLEMLARNARSRLFPDVAGALPFAGTIRAGGPASLKGGAPFLPLLRAVRSRRVDARLSRNAGRYLCNYAYWLAAELMVGRPFLFVHVPLIARKAARRGKRRRLAAADLARAGEVLLLALAAAARRGVPIRDSSARNGN